MTHGIPDIIRLDNGQHFISKCFTLFHTYLRVEKLAMTEFLSHTNMRLGRYNKNLVSRLWPYIADNKQNWGTFIKPLTHAYNCQILRSPIETPFILTFSRHTPRPTIVASLSTLTDNTASVTDQKEKVLHQISAMKDQASNILTSNTQSTNCASTRRLLRKRPWQ